MSRPLCPNELFSTVQGHSRLLTFIQIESPLQKFMLVNSYFNYDKCRTVLLKISCYVQKYASIWQSYKRKNNTVDIFFDSDCTFLQN